MRPCCQARVVTTCDAGPGRVSLFSRRAAHVGGATAATFPSKWFVSEPLCAREHSGARGAVVAARIARIAFLHPQSAAATREISPCLRSPAKLLGPQPPEPQPLHNPWQQQAAGARAPGDLGNVVHLGVREVREVSQVSEDGGRLTMAMSETQPGAAEILRRGSRLAVPAPLEPTRGDICGKLAT
ncbi:unnamed protein product [Lampetra planeri]